MFKNAKKGHLIVKALTKLNDNTNKDISSNKDITSDSDIDIRINKLLSESAKRNRRDRLPILIYKI